MRHDDNWEPTGGNDLYSKSKFTVRKERWVKADMLDEVQRALAAATGDRERLRKENKDLRSQLGIDFESIIKEWCRRNMELQETISLLQKEIEGLRGR